jgi:hypothetical protein
MATLKDYFESKESLKSFIEQYDLKYFIETGTGIGDTVAFVQGQFKMIYSIEMIEGIYKKALSRFINNYDVCLINDDSKNALKQTLKIKLLDQGNILYFLDAHFPGADFKYAEYDSESDPDIRIPLHKELETIVDQRGTLLKNDVIIIDDLRIYEDGPYDAGNWPLRQSIGGEGIDFIYELFGETHYIEKDYRYQGFIILKPIS